MAKGAWSDSYLFYLKYHGKPENEGFWERVLEDYEAIVKKYQGARICRKLMQAAYGQLEDEKDRERT